MVDGSTAAPQWLYLCTWVYKCCIHVCIYGARNIFHQKKYARVSAVNSVHIHCLLLRADHQFWHVKCNLPLTYVYSACSLTANICWLISLYIVNHQECFKKIITTVLFSRNHQPRRPKIATIVYVNAMQVCKMQFYWSSQIEWLGINQSATIFLPHVHLHMTSFLSVLMQTWPPVRLCAIYWLIFLCSWPEMGAQRLPQGVSTLRSLVDMQCQLVF